MEDFNSKYTGEEVEELLNQIANKEHTTVGFANDLTGVIEATAEEFTFRPSAGDKSIRDESAVIRRIKGNTTVWTQCCKNPYLELDKLYNKNQRNASYTNTDGGLRITYNSDGNPPDFYLFATQLGNLVKGHIYMISIDARVSGGLNVEMSLYPNYDTALRFYPNGEWNRYAGLYTLTRDTFTGYYYVGIREITTTTIHAGDYFEFRNAQFIDLTRLFGAGNEPTTIEGIQSKFPDSYYPYSEPEVRNVNTTLIMTIGFNQWDEQWELGALATNTGGLVGHSERGRSVNFFDVIPNASYYCATIAPTTTNSGGTVGSIGVWWYDSNQTFIKYEDITNRTRIAPSNARYAKICSYGGDVNAIFNSGVNINLSHSKVRNGEYEPYKKNIRLLPEIRKYFPYGMNGNANVWDEINSEKAIKRWGVVDLGSLTWSVQQASVNIFWSNSVTGLKKAPYSSYPNAISIFDTGRFYDLQVAKSNSVTTEIIGVHDAQARIMLYNPNYEATTEGAAQLKASLQGVLLYYELTEPEYTDITEPMQLDYEVEDFGTEKALSLASSAPFRADIVYQFNAEGRIRDNSRNIERIENTITNRLTPSQTAMLGLPNKVMTWNGSSAMMSLPIAESIEEWEMEESPFGVLPTGKQVIEYISLIKGSLATGLMPKKTLTIDASGFSIIDPNKVYEITTKSSTTYNYDLYLLTTNGVDVIADNEWRIRIDTRNGFSGRIGIEPSGSGYSISWAYPEDVNLGAGTAPTIKADFIYDIQFRMIDKTLLGSYKKYR